jgi:hypothetical protein
MSIDLFTLPPASQVGVYIPTGWRLLRDGLVHNVSILQEYHRHASPPASATHPLLRLLHDISVPQNDDPYAYLNTISGQVLRYGSLQGLTTAVSVGRPFNSVFYDAPVTELLIGHDEEFRVYEEIEDWKSIEAVRVLMHPKSDLYLQVLNGKPYSDQEGLAVIGINIPLLALQYWCYRKSDENQGVQHFLSTYVVPNMLQSHLEIAWINRLFMLDYGVDPDMWPICRTHKVAMPRYEHLAQGVCDQVLSRLDRTNQRMDHLLQNIPAYYHLDALGVMRMPSVASTQQGEWALLCARLKIMSWLTDISERNNKSNVNRDYGLDLRQLMQTHQCLAAMRSRLPPNSYIEQESYIENIYDRLLGTQLHGA